jgi:transcriptional regulator with XRE-family HTH domain
VSAPAGTVPVPPPPEDAAVENSLGSHTDPEGHTDPEIEGRLESSAEDTMPLPSWATGSEPLRPVPSHFRYDPPRFVTGARRPKRSTAAWYAQGELGHSIGLGYLILTLREMAALSQSRLAARAGTSQPAIARLESGRQVPTVNTLLRIAGACGMHLVVGLADPRVDMADLCMHDLTVLGVLRPDRLDDLPNFFVLREPPPWAGEG